MERYRDVEIVFNSFAHLYSRNLDVLIGNECVFLELGKIGKFKSVNSQFFKLSIILTDFVGSICHCHQYMHALIN